VTDEAGIAAPRRRPARAAGGRGRWSLVSRILAALVGGYAFTSLLTLALTVSLPAFGIPRAEALLAASMSSFLVYTAVIMAVVHASSATRAWRGLLIGAVPWVLVLALQLPGSAP
jgi:hypothetical protein